MTLAHTVARHCMRLGGSARTRELLEAGFSRSAIRAALRSGEVERLREGVFVSYDLSDEARAAILHGGVLGCRSAAAAAGLWVLDLVPSPTPETEDAVVAVPANTGGAAAAASVAEASDARDPLRAEDGPAPVHVSMPARGHARHHDGCTCVSHWSSKGSARAAVAASYPGVRVTVEAALADLFTCQGEEAFFVAFESALRKRMLSTGAVAGLRARLPTRARWLVDFARRNADSGLESLLRLRLARRGIELRSQIDVPGVGIVDFVLGDRLIIEVDGRENHDGTSLRHKDLVRDANAAALGMITLRFDYALVMHDRALVEAAILGAVEHELHLRPTSRR